MADEDKKETSEEFERFASLARRLFAVSKKELQRKQEELKKRSREREEEERDLDN